ncbi:FAD binding domain [Seminavis robusta]|uniref:FAD binding domain n=1 Tax=Seminavis robusta TaxID=568900 RepID=A0A9N8EKH9_9STRA|nr:FAD binding domain [Seminavis robusta]|eukprot:Sro1077_g238660.1 FAD binding domain (180) ;mRNA; f:26812-27351
MADNGNYGNNTGKVEGQDPPISQQKAASKEASGGTGKEGAIAKKKSTNDKMPRPTRPRPQHRTLCSLLHYFVGMELSVELKTGRTYRGTLATADEYMNLALDEVEQVEPPSQNNITMITCHIRGPNIRFIHFPSSDLRAAIRTGQDRERAAKQKYQGGKRQSRSVTTGGKAQPDVEQRK